jgi:hypothetical protein
MFVLLPKKTISAGRFSLLRSGETEDLLLHLPATKFTLATILFLAANYLWTYFLLSSSR